MGATLHFEVDSADVDDFFVQLRARAATPEPFLGFVGQDMIAKFRENIDKESGGPDFPAWAPLKEATVAQREREGYGGEHPILQRERDLYSHLTFSVSGATVSAGTDGSLVYPAVHDIGEGAMPQRSFVWIDDPRVEGWIEVLSQFLIEGTSPPAAQAAE